MVLKDHRLANRFRSEKNRAIAPAVSKIRAIASSNQPSMINCYSLEGQGI